MLDSDTPYVLSLLKDRTVKSTDYSRGSNNPNSTIGLLFKNVLNKIEAATCYRKMKSISLQRVFFKELSSLLPQITDKFHCAV